MTEFTGNSDERMAELYLERAAGVKHEYSNILDSNWYPRRVGAIVFNMETEYRAIKSEPLLPIAPNCPCVAVKVKAPKYVRITADTAECRHKSRVPIYVREINYLGQAKYTSDPFTPYPESTYYVRLPIPAPKMPVKPVKESDFVRVNVDVAHALHDSGENIYYRQSVVDGFSVYKLYEFIEPLVVGNTYFKLENVEKKPTSDTPDFAKPRTLVSSELANKLLAKEIPVYEGNATIGFFQVITTIPGNTYTIIGVKSNEQ